MKHWRFYRWYICFPFVFLLVHHVCQSTTSCVNKLHMQAILDSAPFFIRSGRATNSNRNLQAQEGGGRAQPWPRNIRLCCISRQQKFELFRLQTNVREHPQFANVRIMNDLNNDQLMAYREVQSIHNVASKLPNVSSRMKGNKIELNGKIYTRDMFDKLPAGLTLENCATRPTPDGIAFQGHSAPLSNFYPCVIHDATTGQVYNSAEQMYAHKTALAHHNKAIAEHILREKNPYTIKQL